MTSSDEFEGLRRLAEQFPAEHAGAMAVALADRGLQSLDAGDWERSVSALDEARFFTNLARSAQRGTVRVGGTAVTRTGKSTLLYDLLQTKGKVTTKTSLREIAQSVYAEARAVASSDHGGDLLPERDHHRPQSQLPDLDSMIDDARMALASAEDDPARATLSAGLGTALLARSAASADIAGLDEAVEVLSTAIGLLPTASPDRPSVLSAAGAALRARHALIGAPDGLALAVAHLAEAVDLTAADDPQMPNRLTHLGSGLLARYEWSGDVADLTAARDYLQAAVRGSSGLNRASGLAGLGNVLTELGHLRLAHDRLAEALKIRRELLGVEHLDTLTVQNNLAAVLADMGGNRKAVQEASVLEARMRLLGPEHPDTLATRFNLALARADLDELRQVLHIRERVLGPGNPETVRTRQAWNELR